VMRPQRRLRAFLAVAAIILAAGAVSAATSAPQSQVLNLETFDAAWSIINETHWDAEFNGVDWKAVRQELRPRAAEARSTTELRVVINEMIARLGQSHFALWPRGRVAAPRSGDGDRGAGAMANPDGARGGVGDPGFHTVLIDDQFVVARIASGGPAAEAGVQQGWIVLSAAGVDVDTAALQPVDGVDRHRLLVQAQRGMDRRLSGAPGGTLDLVLLDGADVKHEIEVRLARPPGELSRFGNMPPIFAHLESRVLAPDVGMNVGVIAFNIWLPQLMRPFDAAIDTMRQADGIILDLRGNPGGVGGMVMGVGGHFVEEFVALGTMRTRADELKFVANPRRINSRGELVDPFAGPLAILMDRTSASTSEVFAGGLQAIGRARVFGQRSMGAVLPSLMDDLPNGDVLQHAIADFVVSANDVRLEGRGVIPDEEVRITRADLLAGHDPTLEAAVEWVVRQR